MTRQDEILRGCNHLGGQTCEVSMPRGEVLSVCSECWNASVYVRRAERKQQLANHWKEYREAQAVAMENAGAHVGQRVHFFAASMLGPMFGGLVVTGTIRVNHNGVCYVRLDRPANGKKTTEWNRAWKSIA